ncbi:hypothetical protein MMC32_006109 [Xylographa parallela]|nr:hypothetical protein [Xylographa parallela]
MAQLGRISIILAPPSRFNPTKLNSSAFQILTKGESNEGIQQPATWMEFQIKADNDGAAHGDISLEQGCDGAAVISATNGSGHSNGFLNDILSEAPEAALRQRSDGVRLLATRIGNLTGGPNQAAIDYLNQVVGQQNTYIVGGTGTDDVASSNMSLAVDFY